MIQDIYPLHLDNTYQNIKPTADSYVIAFSDDRIFLKKEEEITYLTYGQLEMTCRRYHREIPECRYIFSVGEEKYFLVELWEACEIPGFSYYRMFETRTMKPKEKVFVAATAWHLYVWYRDNRFCGRCGETLVHSSQQRMLECLHCSNQVYPKIAVAVIVGVTDGSKILMTKYVNREYKRYALIAGFTEIGETAEETVKREVEEEVGLHVKNIRYYKSQPWGYDSNFLLGYFCELEGSAEIRMDESELSVAEWVDYKDIPDDPEGLSLTREMMLYFRDYCFTS
jgi:NAD+ diphosphatase